MKFVLYYNNVCPGARACRILLRHLETDYSEVSVDLNAKEQMSDEFLKMNPDHCVPTLKRAPTRRVAVLFLGRGWRNLRR